MIKNINPLTPREKPWVIQSFLTFDSMDRTIHGKAVEQYFNVVLVLPRVKGLNLVSQYIVFRGSIT